MRKKIKSNFIEKSVVFLICLLGFCSFTLWAKVINKTVATVNGEVILLDEYQKKTELFIDQYKKIAKEKDLESKIGEIKKEILNQMIDEKLMFQEAEKKKIKISKRKIEKGVDSVKERFSGEEEFKKELKRQKITQKEFKEKISKQLMVMELIDMSVRSKISEPTAAEIEEFYKKNKDKMVEPEGVRVRHILIPVSDDATKSQKASALKKIKEAQKKLKKGDDFGEVAKEYSKDPASSKRGGDLGFFVRGEMVPEFEKASFALNVGQTSDIVKTKFGYHIIKCEEKRARQKKILEEVKDNLKNLIFRQKMEEKYEKWIKALRNKANIKISKEME